MKKELAKVLESWDRAHEFYTQVDRAQHVMQWLESMGVRFPHRDYTCYISCVDNVQAACSTLKELNNE